MDTFIKGNYYLTVWWLAYFFRLLRIQRSYHFLNIHLKNDMADFYYNAA